MASTSLVASFAVIFIAAAILATLSLQLRLPMLIAYILVGAVIGPFGLGLAPAADVLSDISQFGIVFLLFLLGLDMSAGKLVSLFRQTLIVGIGSCLLFFGLGAAAGLIMRLSPTEIWILGATMMFSSTIVGIKLLPTDVLHHRHIGEMMVSVLLFQDLVAIILLGTLTQAESADTVSRVVVGMIALPALVGLAFLLTRFALLPLINRFAQYSEYVFLVAIGWCLGLAALFHQGGMSYEIGAFVAGVSLSVSPKSEEIADTLKPLRDFFLTVFFFTLGARFDLSLVTQIWLPVLVLLALVISVKPLVFSALFRFAGETKRRAWEVGFRLAQGSEFSLLIAYLAGSTVLISAETSHIIQAVAILSFAVSTLIVVNSYPSPSAIKGRFRRD